jgi:predicted ATPase with chaperone activity
VSVLATIEDIQNFAAQVRENVARVIVGKASTIDLLLVALLCGGHALLEDVPGVGKTMMARAGDLAGAQLPAAAMYAGSAAQRCAGRINLSPKRW